VKRLSISQLAASNYDLAAPFELSLVADASESVVTCVDVLRWLPGRRLVARVDWPVGDSAASSVTAVLKLFIGRGADRYCDRERAGLATLRELNFQVPEQLAEVAAADGATGLVSRFIADSAPVSVSDSSALNTLTWHFAKMHEAGVWHDDLNLDNFLMVQNTLWFVDGDAVRRQSAPLVALPGLSNLARLLAERPPIFDAELEQLAHGYFSARGWPEEAQLVKQLEKALALARRKRIARYLKKTQRNCSEFVVSHDLRHRSVRQRQLSADVWQAFRADPDTIVANAQLLKDGNSATVVRWQPVQGPALIIKRYNVKSPWHALRRMLRPVPRFRRSWQNGHRLSLLGIPTARPLALLERRLGPFRGVAYLLMTDLGDHTLAGASDSVLDRRINEVTDLFVLLRKLELQHGDGKASNFLLHEDRLHLIDLDAMRPSATGWSKDVARFLANWRSPQRERIAAVFHDRQLLR
jgi:tRNA A-37 threonylcarbamoyl transferase component Bud32